MYGWLWFMIKKIVIVKCVIFVLLVIYEKLYYVAHTGRIHLDFIDNAIRKLNCCKDNCSGIFYILNWHYFVLSFANVSAITSSSHVFCAKKWHFNYVFSLALDLIQGGNVFFLILLIFSHCYIMILIINSHQFHILQYRNFRLKIQN